VVARPKTSGRQAHRPAVIFRLSAYLRP
jgi:hypothetical protein